MSTNNRPRSFRLPLLTLPYFLPWAVAPLRLLGKHPTRHHSRHSHSVAARKIQSLFSLPPPISDSPLVRLSPSALACSLLPGYSTHASSPPKMYITKGPPPRPANAFCSILTPAVDLLRQPPHSSAPAGNYLASKLILLRRESARGDRPSPWDHHRRPSSSLCSAVIIQPRWRTFKITAQRPLTVPT